MGGIFVTWIVTTLSCLLCSSLADRLHRSVPNDRNGSALILDPVCAQPLAEGSCRGKIPRYYFNGETKTCEMFYYGGCNGNGNNFESARHCSDTCITGLHYGVQSPECEQVKCPGGTSHYRELGCKPLYDDGACCPTRFDCPDITTKKNSNQCVYNGKVYNVGDNIPEADSGLECRTGCSCTGQGIDCANVECADLFGYYPNENCTIGLYKRGDCCAYDYACGNETKTCEFEGKDYIEGEKIYPKDYPCLVCYCKPGFNGSLSSEFCEVVNCGNQIWYSQQLEQGCTPVYYVGSDSKIGCCPISWHCPDSMPELVGLEKNRSLELNELSSNLTTDGNNSNETFTGGPIEGNFSSFESICEMPMAKGNCMASRPRYYFNNDTGICDEFTYSGCEGNGNNFVTKADCVRTCVDRQEDEGLLGRLASVAHVSPRTSLNVDPCSLEVAPGRCRAFFPRYFFSPATNRCQFFIYGGCGRNQNNFYTKEACEATCLQTYPNSCDKKPYDLIKNCGKENVSKYYFDANANRCKVFTSTGCSKEPFFTGLDECTSVCVPSASPAGAASHKVHSYAEKENICHLPKRVGPCYAYFPSFYYDTEAKSCQPFVYGGCFGNQNRFTSKESCEITCEFAGEALRPLIPVAHSQVHFLEESRKRARLFAASNFTSTGNDSSLPHDANDGSSRINRASMIFPEDDSFPGSSLAAQDSTNDSLVGKVIFARSVNSVQKHQDFSEKEALTSTTPVLKAEESSTESSIDMSINPLEVDSDDAKEPNVQEDNIALLTEEAQQKILLENGMDKTDELQEKSYTVQILNENSTDNQPLSSENIEITTDEESMNKSSPILNYTVHNNGKFSPNYTETRLPSGKVVTSSITNRITRQNSKTSRSPELSTDTKENSDTCQQPMDPGACNQTVLRFYWSGSDCRPFNYTGCGGNKNQFVSEFDCQRACGDSFENTSQKLVCVFGDYVIPYGESLPGDRKCGSHFCTCAVPPVLTCTVMTCL